MSTPAQDDPRPGDAEPADRPEHGSEEEIDEVGDESFPASDAPPWWSGDNDDPDR